MKISYIFGESMTLTRTFLLYLAMIPTAKILKANFRRIWPYLSKMKNLISQLSWRIYCADVITDTCYLINNISLDSWNNAVILSDDIPFKGYISSLSNKWGLQVTGQRVSLILHCKSDFPVARISKWSHLMMWPVEITWLAKLEAWQSCVRAVKCSVFLSCNRRFVLLT